MKHQALKMMADRRLSLRQKRIGHWMGKVAVGHRPNPGDPGGVRPTKPVDELVLGVVADVSGRQ